jgi:ATP/maltotriose-dependent transcriptional regulator MalT/DNA-binding SARP family transcriptional activator
VAQIKQRGIAYAKTTRPVIGNVVRREALIARLDQSERWTVAWISGPAGAGKSTLAASYVEARRYPSIWYQLDPDDADVATFFHYLAHAARRFDEGKPHDLPAFTPQHAGDVAAFSRRFFRQLFLRAKTPAALVLDNLNDVSAGSALYAAIEAGLAQVPGHCRVFITSRAEPPAALARMRVSGGLMHIGWQDLRLNAREIGEIAQIRGQPLSDDEIATLDQRTQGWAAGLVLMLEHAKVSGRIAELPGDAAPTVMFDYLAGEIFERFDPHIQQFLLRIACLPRMSAEVAAALSGEERAGRILLNMARNDYFVREVPADSGQIYQLHPLLRDFLRNRALQTLPEAVSAQAPRRAAQVLHNAGNREDAIALLAESRDWDAVARSVAENANEMLSEGRGETLRGWLELLPAPLLDADPRLLYAHAESRVHASTRLARRQYAQAFDGFRRANDSHGMLRSCRGMVSAIILEFDDFTLLDEWTEKLAALLDSGNAGNAGAAAAATLVRARLLRDPGNDDIERRLNQAERAANEMPDAAAAGAVLDELSLARAMYALLRADAAIAAASTGALLARAQAHDPDTAIALAIITALAQLLAGAHDEALSAVRQGQQWANSADSHACDAWLRMIATAAALATGNRDAARDGLLAVDIPGVPLRRGDQALNHYLRGWLAALENNPTTAGRESKMALALADELGMPGLACLARIAAAQQLFGEGDHRGADAILRRAQDAADATRSPLLRATAKLALAGAALAAGNADATLEPLRSGFQFAREHGMRHLIALRPALLAELCAAALRNGIEADFARAIVRSAQLAPPASALRLRQWPRPFHVFMLGGFQLLRDGTPLEFSGKGPGRPVELLKVLVALGAQGTQGVRGDQIADALWPRVDADYAHKSFTIALHRLRRMLDEDETLLLNDGRLSLNPKLVWLDTWALDQLLAEIDAALREPRPRPDPALHALIDEALALYRGPLLPDESEQPSYIGSREQIRAKLLRSLSRATRAWEDAGAHDTAADCYSRLIDADPLFEAAYRNLMQCHQRHHDLAEARATYERLRVVLATRLKTVPAAETEAILKVER